MKVSFLTRWGIGMVVFAALAGCSGGGSDDDPQESARLVQEATTSLNAMLCGGTAPGAQNLQSLSTKFTQALEADRSNNQAAFGFGISTVAYRAQLLVDLISTGRDVPTAANDPLLEAVRLTTPWRLSPPTETSAIEGLRLALAAPYAMSRLSRQVNPANVRTALTNLMNSIDAAIPTLQQASAQTNFTYTIADFESCSTSTATRTVDQADVQSLLAGMYAARAILSMALAYDFNYGTFDFNQTVEDRFATQLANGTPLTPNDYLPAAPFGQLTGGGAALMLAAQNHLSLGANMANTALTTLQARPSQTGHLIDATGLNFTEASAGIALFNNALTQPVTVGSDPPVTINANAWFTSPPADLRALLPTYQTNASGAFTNESSYPDPTLDGLLVDPPDDLFAATVAGNERVGVLAARAFLEF